MELLGEIFSQSQPTLESTVELEKGCVPGMGAQ
jgi:hypothetical protein